MHTYLILLRGINVGGKNKMPMATLRTCLEGLGYKNVASYIASGNIILDSDQDAPTIKASIEAVLPKHFSLDTTLLRVLVMTPSDLSRVMNEKPDGFGEQPDTYHSDAIFLIDTTVEEVTPLFSPRDGVDRIWPGTAMVYSQRLSAERTKSRLSKIMESPLYQQKTIRSWNTVEKLRKLLDSRR